MGFWKKITGIEKIEKARAVEEARLEKILEETMAAAAAQAEQEEARKQAEAAAAEEKDRLKKEEAFNKLDPKAQATEKNEPWVSVLNTHVNEDDIRNGFFELDWNNVFIQQLVIAGYGTEADPEEEIVDRWFRGIVSQMLSEEGLDPQSRGAGYINVAPLSQGRSEVS